MEKLLRNLFLFLAKNKTMMKLAKKYGLQFGAHRFVAGETIESAIEKIKDLEQRGFDVTVDYLGEFVDNEEEAVGMANHCIETIEAIASEQLKAQISLKMTSMGLDISDELVIRNMRRILDKAKHHNIFVTIDMEDESRCERTLTIFKQLKADYDNVGTVIQAYLYRSEQDLDDLNPYSPFIRLVKGAYKEPHNVAFPDKKDVDENFKKLIQKHMLNGNYTAVATHDDAIIEFTKDLVQACGINRSKFEFQMLYGIKPERQQEILDEGYKMRIYVPYGSDWYGYFMRRLAERPANVAFVLKGIFKK